MKEEIQRRRNKKERKREEKKKKMTFERNGGGIKEVKGQQGRGPMWCRGGVGYGFFFWCFFYILFLDVWGATKWVAKPLLRVHSCLFPFLVDGGSIP